MRKTIWRAIRRNIPIGEVLPWWAIAIRAALFPIDFLYWRMSLSVGYQWKKDIWLINGVTYSGETLFRLSKAKGEVYRITRIDDNVRFERVYGPISEKMDDSRNPRLADDK